MNELEQILRAYQQNIFAREGATTDVLALYQDLPDKSITDNRGKSLYHIAAGFLDYQAIELLGKEGVKPRPDHYDNTPLHALVQTPYGNDITNYTKRADDIYKTALALLDLNVNPKKKNESGQTAYFQAGINAMYPFIKAMADRSVRMDAVNNENKNILHVICDQLYHRKTIRGVPEAAYQTVKILLESGIDPEDKDVFGTTALTYAQRSGVKEIAALISGDSNAVKTGGMTLSEAVLKKDTEAIEALIEQGNDINELSETGRTPLMLACEYPSLEIIRLLISKGADINYKSGETGCTATCYLLSKAISNLGKGVAGGQDPKLIIRILQTLIDSGLDINQTVDGNGNTALNLLCSLDYMGGINNSLAEELIHSGCNLNLPNISGCTPLMTFAARGNEAEHNIAELLLDNAADYNLTDCYSNTALIYAAGNNNKMSAKKIVELLLDAGDKGTDKANNNGKTALDVAVDAGNEAVVKLLLNHIS